MLHLDRFSGYHIGWAGDYVVEAGFAACTSSNHSHTTARLQRFDQNRKRKVFRHPALGVQGETGAE